MTGPGHREFSTALLGAALAIATVGCGGDERSHAAASATTTTGPSEPTGPIVTNPDPELLGLGSRAETRERVCARGRQDSVALALCGAGEAPAIQSLEDVLQLVRLADPAQRAFALTGNSTSLVAQSVSAVNPRIIVFPRVGAAKERLDEMTAVGFVRGEQFVELVSRDLATDQLNFYLLSFEQSCSYEADGCDLASLLTEEIEHDWTGYSIYDQEDLEGTSFDCLSCHRPGGVGTPHILRMQELESPWLHWFPQRFGQRTESDRTLLAQFGEAHEVESQYGGIPIATIVSALDEGSGAQLEALVRSEGFGEQPNPFDPRIAAEAKAGDSATWETRFDAHLNGHAIAVPYPAIDVTDPDKRSAAVKSFRDVVTGAVGRESLVDIRDVFSDDAAVKLSFLPWPTSDGRAVLMQMCGRCHDGRGNPALRKNLFDVLRLDEMSRDLKDTAIARITATDLSQMPPHRVGRLTPEAMASAVAELQR